MEIDGVLCFLPFPDILSPTQGPLNTCPLSLYLSGVAPVWFTSCRISPMVLFVFLSILSLTLVLSSFISHMVRVDWSLDHRLFLFSAEELNVAHTHTQIRQSLEVVRYMLPVALEYSPGD